jgi:hypothetical protein
LEIVRLEFEDALTPKDCCAWNVNRLDIFGHDGDTAYISSEKWMAHHLKALLERAGFDPTKPITRRDDLVTLDLVFTQEDD